MRDFNKVTGLLALLLWVTPCVAQTSQSFTPASAQPSIWRHLGPPGGNVISLATSATSVIYVGTPDGHVFESSDDAQHWVLRSRVTARHDAVIQKLLVNVQRDNEILAAVWFQDVREGGGLFISHDSGGTWTLAGLAGEIVRTVEQSPSSPDTFVAGTRSGVFRSADGARTWQRISPEGDPELRNVDSLAIDTHDPQIIYAGTYHLPWKTIDAGKHWTAVATGMIDDSDVMSLRVDAASSSRIFASACSGIYRSENAGAVWTKLQGIPFSSRRTQAIVQDGQNPRSLYAATTEGLWVTRDGGEFWVRTTPRDWVVNGVVVLHGRNAPVASTVADDATAAGAAPDVTSAPPPSGEILIGTESQGLLLSTDGGVSFTPANEGFFHRVTAGLVSDPRDAQHLLAWLPDSPDPLLETEDAGTTWQPLPLKVSAAAAPADIARIFGTEAGWWLASASGGVWHYDSEARAWLQMKLGAALTPPAAPGRRRVSPVHRVARRPDTAGLLNVSSDIQDVRTIDARVFASTRRGLWGGTLGQKLLRPITVAKETSPLADSGVWMTVGGRVLWSGDAGKSWHEQSLQISADVTDSDVRWVHELPGPPLSEPSSHKQGSQRGGLLAGTAKGLYRRVDGDAWRPVQRGLPIGDPISWFFNDKVLIIAMRGGGVYVSRDASETWGRLDSGEFAGQFTGAAVGAGRAFIAASLTEGLLYSHIP